MKEQVLSRKKLFMMLVIELFAMTSLILPAVIVGFAGVNGIPFLLIASGFLFFLALWYLECLKKQNKPLDQMVEKEKNFILRRGIKVIYAMRYFLHGLFLTVLFLNLIQEVLLPDYGVAEILLPVLILFFAISGKSIMVRGRLAETLFPYIFLPLFFVLAIALTKVEYIGLSNQLWGTFGRISISQFLNDIHHGYGNARFWNSLYGIYGIFLFYQPIEFILFQLPLADKKISCREKWRTEGEEERRTVRVLGWTCLGVVAINVILYVVTIGMLGTERTGEKLWSALYIMQSVRLPGKFVERLDILFLVFWIFGTLYLISSYMYYGSRLVVVGKEQDEREKRSRLYTWVWIISLFLLASIIKEPRVMFEFFVPYKMWIDFPLALLLPFLLYRRTQNGKIRFALKLKKIAALILCMGLLTGCQNRADIEDKNYIMSIGVEEGQTKEFLFHYEIADLSKGNQESDGRTSKILTYEADSFEEAEELNRISEDKRLDYGHLKVLLFSKEVMNSGEKRTKIVEELKANNALAGTALLFFTDQADLVMENGGKKGTSFGEYMNQMIANQGIGVGKEDTLADLLKDEAEQRGDRPICVLEAVGDDIVLGKDILRREIGKSKIRTEVVREKNVQEKESLKDESDKRSSLTDELVRFHIRANSDSSYDQQKKVAIKNRILPKLQELLKEEKSKENCMITLKESTAQINQWVQEACEEEDYPCESYTYLCRENFPLKIYGDTVIPSGVYDALRIDLGAADGQNWWCMMYPSLCLSEGVVERVSDDGKEVLEEKLSEEDYEEICLNRKENRFHIRWKILGTIKMLWMRENPS